MPAGRQVMVRKWVKTSQWSQESGVEKHWMDVREIALLFLPNTRQLLTIPTYSTINIHNIHTTSFIFFLKPSRD
jgi:hypothetical protein